MINKLELETISENSSELSFKMSRVEWYQWCRCSYGGNARFDDGGRAG